MTYSITFDKGEISILQDLLDRHMQNVKQSDVFLKTELDEKLKNLTEIKRKLRFLDMPTTSRVKKTPKKITSKKRGPYKKRDNAKKTEESIQFVDIPTSEEMIKIMKNQFRFSQKYDQAVITALYTSEYPQTVPQIYQAIHLFKEIQGLSPDAVYQGVYKRLQTYAKHGLIKVKAKDGKRQGTTYQPLRGTDPLRYVEKKTQEVLDKRKEEAKVPSRVIMKTKEEMIQYVKKYLTYQEEYDNTIFKILFDYKKVLTPKEIFKIASSPFNFEIYATDITEIGLDKRLEYFTSKGLLKKGGTVISPTYQLYTNESETEVPAEAGGEVILVE